MDTYFIEGLMVRRIDAGREINYEIFEKSGYLCRLVPGMWGFEVSKLDLCFDTEIPDRLVAQIGDFIINMEE